MEIDVSQAMNFLFADLELGSVGGGETIGAVGQLIAAVLQTAGLHAQKEVILFFTPVLQSIGAFLYVVSIVMALSSVAAYGDYKKALYYLIGPALFLFMLTETVPASHTLLQYGARVTPATKEDQLSFLGAISRAFDGDAEVSWFFRTYDGVVSSVVQQTVSMLLDTENKRDLIAKARERVFSRVLMAEAIDPVFTKLLSKGYLGHCGELARLSMELAQPRLRDAVEGTREYDEKLIKEEKLKKYFTVRSIELDPDELLFAEMYGYNAGALQEGVDCKFVWELIKEAALKAAETQLEHFSSQSGLSDDIPWEKVRQEVLNTISPDNPERAVEIIAAYVIKNSLERTAHSALTSQLTSRVPFVAAKFNGVFGDFANAQAQGGYMRIAYFAGMVPYVQGLLLFLLTAGFPFFTVFLIMPERMSAFFIWMTLWLWVKSWDLGFALVDIVREILFPYLSHEVNLATTPPDWNDPAGILNIIYENDPLANYNTYLTIIGLLRLAVPVVTAHLCLGATKLLSAFKRSLGPNVDQFTNLRTNFAKRQFATGAKAMVDQMNADARKTGLLEGAANPGDTSTGQSRFWSMSGAVARHMHGRANEEGAYSFYSPQEYAARQYIAGFTVRRMSYGYSMIPRDIAQDELNRMNEPIMVSNPFAQTLYPGASDNMNDMNTNLPRLDSGYTAGDEGGGGE